MLWQLEWGPSEASLRKLKLNPLPAALLRKPRLPDKLMYIWKAFRLLDSARQQGPNVPQRLPFDWVHTFAKRVCTSNEEYEEFLELIYTLDNLVVEHEIKKHNQRVASQKK